MKLPDIYCLMSSAGRPLNRKMRDILFLNAYDMLDCDRRKQVLRGKGYEGEIKTDLTPVAFSGVSIVVFEARLETNKAGEVYVRYGIRPTEIDPELLLSSGKWGSWDDFIEEITEWVKEHEDD